MGANDKTAMRMVAAYADSLHASTKPKLTRITPKITQNSHPKISKIMGLIVNKNIDGGKTRSQEKFLDSTSYRRVRKKEDLMSIPKLTITCN